MMETELAFTPLVPWTIVWAAAAVCVAFVALALWRGLPGWWLRLAGFAVLLAALAGPVLRQEERETLSNIVFVVADRTESQSVDVRPAQIEAGLSALRSELGDLENFETRFVEVENDAGAADDGSFVLTALAKAASEVAIVACTDSEHGVHILSGADRWQVPAVPTQIVDATGAGDLFAGAFLWGLTNGHDLQTCGKMGNLAASEVISHIGARPEADLRKMFKDAGLV